MVDARDPIRDFAAHVAPGVASPVVFDVGTNRGQILDRVRSALPSAVFHAFEPNPALSDELARKYAGQPGITVNGVGVGREDGSLRLTLSRYDETSSFLPTTSHYRDLRWAASVGEVDVPVVRLDRYCRDHAIEDVHLVKVDTQGFELHVMQGAEGILPRVWAVYLEVLFTPLYEGQAEFWQLDRFLRGSGFRLFNLYHLSTHEETGQLGAGDAMWVNNDKVRYYRPRQPWEAELERNLGIE